MDIYLNALRQIKDTARKRSNRTGIDSYSLKGLQMRFDLSKGFPLLTTKTVPFKAVAAELLWFISGSTDNTVLTDQNVHIWDSWAVDEAAVDTYVKRITALTKENREFTQDKEIAAATANARAHIGSIGNLYGHTWRNLPGTEIEVYDYIHGDQSTRRLCQETASDKDASHALEIIDQLAVAVRTLKENPFSRRIIVSAWIPQFLPNEKLSPKENVLLGRGALAPCHCLFQFMVDPPIEPNGKNILTCSLYQRSADFPIGVPFNIASYALLTHLVAKVVNMDVGEFIWTGGDCHIYENQMDGVMEQLSRTPTKLPTLSINDDVSDLFQVKLGDFRLNDYIAQSAIKMPVAI